MTQLMSILILALTAFSSQSFAGNGIMGRLCMTQNHIYQLGTWARLDSKCQSPDGTETGYVSAVPHNWSAQCMTANGVVATIPLPVGTPCVVNGVRGDIADMPYNEPTHKNPSGNIFCLNLTNNVCTIDPESPAYGIKSSICPNVGVIKARLIQKFQTLAPSEETQKEKIRQDIKRIHDLCSKSAPQAAPAATALGVY